MPGRIAGSQSGASSGKKKAKPVCRVTFIDFSIKANIYQSWTLGGC